ncbi:hypothetical protein ACN081_02200 [Rothia sp. P13129]|uniref:hypothetical protein n=1 Tax=Rothia sp. P13129 TaxID=3402664 RepID=UPI003AD00D91
MANTKPLIFNPDSLWFIASRYGVNNMADLANLLGFNPDAVQSWAQGKTAPTNNEAVLLMHKTGLPAEWFAKSPETPLMAA